MALFGKKQEASVATAPAASTKTAAPAETAPAKPTKAAQDRMDHFYELKTRIHRKLVEKVDMSSL